MPICVGDNIEFAINYFSMRGLIDTGSLNWLPPVLSQTPLENNLTYSREKQLQSENDKAKKVMADLGRICELEDSEVEWRDLRYEPKIKSQINLSTMEPYFVIKEAETSSIDIFVLKVRLIALKPGNR